MVSCPRALAALAAVAVLGVVPTARAADAPTYTIDPHVTDAAIIDTPSPVPGTRGQHLVWLAPKARRVNRLLVFLPTGGPTNLPSEFSELGTVAGGLGYHAIFLAYRNEAPIAANPPAGCGNAATPPDSPPDCAFNIRKEILDGGDESPVVSIDRANSIENRLNKLLDYLARQHPEDGWAQFVDSNGEPKWSETVVAGSSLGAGEVAIIASRHRLYRAALLHGWTDANHGWVTLNPAATPSDRYFTLIHARDAFFARTCFAYVKLGLADGCPLSGFPLPIQADNPNLIENRQPPFGTQVHVFDLEPGSFAGTGDVYHQSTSRDGWIAREKDGTPSHFLVNAWRSVLGDRDADGYLDEADNCQLVANADQTDSDKNGTGDACGPTFAAGSASGTVPATLALTLGTAAGFGTFTPGLEHSYDASTTATVISTAGDAALAASDPGPTAPGRLVNGAFALAEPLQASGGGAFAPVSASPLTLAGFAGPVSNGLVTIAFRQHIGPTQALRTGTYSKTLTLTLSTTTP